MTELAGRLAALRTRFLDRLGQDCRQLDDIMTGELLDSELATLRHIAHKLAGTSGSLGFPDVSEAAMALDREWNLSSANMAELRAKVEALRDVARKHLASS